MTKVGVIGGGQLARMMIGPSVELGLELRVLAETSDSSARDRTTSVGDYRDLETVLAFAREVDVITFDHEHVPSDIIVALEKTGVAVRPGSAALTFAQDKILMRERLEELGHPLPVWSVAHTPEDVSIFLEANGGRIIAKVPRGGYDGKGVAVVTDPEQLDEWLARGPVLLEEMVDFSRELAQLVARRPTGETAAWPVVETTQANGVCAEVILPAPTENHNVIEVAAELGRQIAHDLDVTGVLAVELFETADGRLLVNELAMRPHNSGHVTIEGSVTSQFEQHLRAVTDIPLGSTESQHPWAVMVNVFGGMDVQRYGRISASSDVKLHNYGKEARAGRKVGHVTATGADVSDTTSRARAVAEIFHADI